jgi:hypothetical protein
LPQRWSWGGDLRPGAQVDHPIDLDYRRSGGARLRPGVDVSEVKTYQGGCHCGNVRFEADLDLSKVYACNCSMCSKMGWRLSFVPETAFRLQKGEDQLSDYQFNKKHIHHYFCRNCGVRSFGQGTDGKGNTMVSINVRSLDDVGETAESLPVQWFDGKSL